MSAPKSTATKQAAASSVSAFKKKKQGRVISLPSGEKILARRVELKSFLAQGDVPNPLLPIIDEALTKGQAMDIDQIMGKEGTVNLDMVNEMFEMVDKVAISCCVQPQVHPMPESEEDRDDDLLYVDELDAEDKMFIFQWAIGGTEDVAQFRLEAEEGLAALGEIQGAGVDAK